MEQAKMSCMFRILTSEVKAFCENSKHAPWESTGEVAITHGKIKKKQGVKIVHNGTH